MARFAIVFEKFLDGSHSLAPLRLRTTLLSMAPLLLVITGLGGFVIGQQAIEHELVYRMNELVGSEGAALLTTVI